MVDPQAGTHNSRGRRWRRRLAVIGVAAGAIVVGGLLAVVSGSRDDIRPLGAQVSPAISFHVEASASDLPAPTPSPGKTETATPRPTATTFLATSAPTQQGASTPAPATATPTASHDEGRGSGHHHVTRIGCDAVSLDTQGAVLVEGSPLPAEYLTDPDRYSMPLAVLRVAAEAPVMGGEACLDVQVAPELAITGQVEICGEVVSQRLAPPETPMPAAPGPTMAPQFGEPTIAGVAIPDRVLDVNSYPALDLADLADVSACLGLHTSRNDTLVDISMSLCGTAILHSDGSLSVSTGDEESTLFPDGIEDADDVLRSGHPAEMGLNIRTHKDDVIHLTSMWVTVARDCPEGV